MSEPVLTYLKMYLSHSFCVTNNCADEFHMLWRKVVRHVYTIFLHARSKKMRDSCAFVIQCYKFPLYFIVVWNKGPLGLKKQQMHTNDVDVSKSCTHVQFFDTHDFFFIRNCMWLLAHLICIFQLMYTWVVLYIKLQGGKTFG